WSSDVCSSDLLPGCGDQGTLTGGRFQLICRPGRQPETPRRSDSARRFPFLEAEWENLGNQVRRSQPSRTSLRPRWVGGRPTEQAPLVGLRSKSESTEGWRPAAMRMLQRSPPLPEKQLSVHSQTFPPASSKQCSLRP